MKNASSKVQIEMTVTHEDGKPVNSAPVIGHGSNVRVATMRAAEKIAYFYQLNLRKNGGHETTVKVRRIV